ncbi:hypothetical protein [Paenibacillus caui]|uniref:hypothetical protein n=1 Tax=Paenibacillus caui TaxID=2873927 RepID=UPI001CA97708|nr:hypothetical protein [Paenibacillus caui]
MDMNKKFKRLNPNPAPVPHHDLAPLRKLGMSIKKVNEQIYQVTVQAEVPHPGYGITISAIRFAGKTAFIYVAPLLPDPGAFYPQVISTARATTYIDAKYTPAFPPEYEPYLSKFI